MGLLILMEGKNPMHTLDTALFVGPYVTICNLHCLRVSVASRVEQKMVVFCSQKAYKLGSLGFPAAFPIIFCSHQLPSAQAALSQTPPPEIEDYLNPIGELYSAIDSHLKTQLCLLIPIITGLTGAWHKRTRT